MRQDWDAAQDRRLLSLAAQAERTPSGRVAPGAWIAIAERMGRTVRAIRSRLEKLQDSEAEPSSSSPPAADR